MPVKSTETVPGMSPGTQSEHGTPQQQVAFARLINPVGVRSSALLVSRRISAMCHSQVGLVVKTVVLTSALIAVTLPLASMIAVRVYA